MEVLEFCLACCELFFWRCVGQFSFEQVVFFFNSFHFFPLLVFLVRCRTFSSPLFPRSWSRHVSDGDHASQGAGHTEHDDELFEWHRHPRKIQPRSSSSSPNNRFRRGRAASKHGNSPSRQKRFGNSLLPAPQMPEDGVAIFCLVSCIVFIHDINTYPAA